MFPVSSMPFMPCCCIFLLFLSLSSGDRKMMLPLVDIALCRCCNDEPTAPVGDAFPAFPPMLPLVNVTSCLCWDDKPTVPAGDPPFPAPPPKKKNKAVGGSDICFLLPSLLRRPSSLWQRWRRPPSYSVVGPRLRWPSRSQAMARARPRSSSQSSLSPPPPPMSRAADDRSGLPVSSCQCRRRQPSGAVAIAVVDVGTRWPTKEEDAGPL